MRRPIRLGLWLLLCPASTLLAHVSPASADEAIVVRDVLHDTSVVLDHGMVRGAEATAFVSVAGATDLDRSAPIDGARITLALVTTEATEAAEGKKGVQAVRHELVDVTTDAGGQTHVRFIVPEVEPGAYKLLIRTQSTYGEDTVERPVSVSARVVVHMRTDRPVYRAGQTLRWRVTALSAADAHPRKNAPVDLAIADPRGTKIWSGRVMTDDTGMISGALPLGEDLILGEYRLSASSEGAQTSETVKVQEFVLPPFSVEVKPSTTGPVSGGSQIQGEVVARYSYGEPVAGNVVFHIGGEEQKGTLDDQGRWSFTGTAPTDGDETTLSATVTDGADRTRTATASVLLQTDRLELAVIPERKTFVSGEALGVTMIVTDGRGNFVPSRVFLKPRSGKRLGGPSPGVSRVSVKTGKHDYSLYMDATAITDDGRTATEQIYVYREYDGAALSVRDAVVKAGEPVRIDGTWPGIRGPLVATLIRGGVPVASALATVGEKGAFVAQVVPPDGVFGLATVRVVDTGFDPKTGDMAKTTAQATVFIRPARLDVSIIGERRHAPGSDVRLAVRVTDAEGRPVEGAGLAAAVVDERVLALGEPRPDLGRILDRLDVSRAEAAGLAFADLLAGDDTPVATAAMRAIVESLPPDMSEPFVRSDAADRVRVELARITEAQPVVYGVVLVDPAPIGVKTGKTWEFASELHVLLERGKWKPARRVTPWGRPTTWAYARKLAPYWTFDSIAPDVANERLDRLETKLRAIGGRARKALHKNRTAALRTLVKSSDVPAYMAVDPWGMEVRVDREFDDDHAWVNLVSAGPDGVYETLDDLSRTDVFHESGWGYGTIGTGYGGGGSGYGVGSGRGGMAAVRISQAVGDQSMVAVRRRFDETVLWVTGVKTGRDGVAQLEVPLADSITGWEVKVEATSPRGAVGTSTSRLETFLPMHVDADVPSGLTRGDRYSVTVVVANHSGRERKLSVNAKTGGSVALMGDARRELTMADGTTSALSFPVDARAIGAGTIDVTLSDGPNPVDAMQRTVRVDPPGSLVRDIASGELAKGTSSVDVNVPAVALAGTVTGRLRVFRGAADQALDGLESLLSEPHGCFEQTSSSTHPNLLVLDLLKDLPGADSIRQRARDYVARGYQRLVSYEVPGGGFSWFGDAPANQVLTAYGVLEFTDMAHVYPVDPDLIDRTRKWLLGKQQSDGSWKPDEAWLHDWSAVQGKVSTTAYVTWALAESGYRGKGVTRALAYLRAHKDTIARDPYLLGLWAGAEAAAGGTPALPIGLLRSFEKRDEGQLRFQSAGRTLFYSKGTGADVQVTALAASALKRSGNRADAAASVAWVWGAREDGGWDSTQGIVMALRAAASLQDREPPRKGSIDVLVDGRPAGKLDLAGDGVPTVELDGLTAGQHKVTLSGAPEGLLYDLRLTYREDGEPTAQAKGIEVSLTPLDRQVRLGGRIGLSVKLRNPGKETVPMPTVVVPVPPGFRASIPSLKALDAKRMISKYEDLGSEVHLYLTELPPETTQTLAFEWDAVAECNVMQRPALAYAYYDPATRGSSGISRLSVTRAPRREQGAAPASTDTPAAPARAELPSRTARHLPPLP